MKEGIGAEVPISFQKFQSMAHFDQDFIDFFKDLSRNNNREWFQENKKRYEKSVKKPFEALISELIGRMQQKDDRIQVAPKDCMLRINRDVRFAKDKTPYNLHYTAIISPAGKKDKSIPGLFLRLSAEEVAVMGGCYGPSKEQLQNLRKAIMNDDAGFKKVISNKKFVEKYGKIRGEEHKRLPKEFAAAAEKQPLIAKKQFYYVANLDGQIITKADLADTLMEYWEAARPVNDYLHKSL